MEKLINYLLDMHKVISVTEKEQHTEIEYDCYYFGKSDLIYYENITGCKIGFTSKSKNDKISVILFVFKNESGN